MDVIRFFEEDVSHKLANPIKTRRWIKSIIREEGFILENLNYILCSDEYLLQVNREYLNHDYYTDIITFNNSESEDQIEGDIFISLERVFENAKIELVSHDEELRRIFAHGVLHLCGYNDHSESEKTEMRSKENYYLLKF